VQTNGYHGDEQVGIQYNKRMPRCTHLEHILRDIRDSIIVYCSRPRTARIGLKFYIKADDERRTIVLFKTVFDEMGVFILFNTKCTIVLYQVNPVYAKVEQRSRSRPAEAITFTLQAEQGTYFVLDWDPSATASISPKFCQIASFWGPYR
jgi:hypothetical protein